ncbi:TlpA disulfide reductase family protein [Lacinutrix sp.]|uniref:TlpA family protein disulfide reductase n=1 Tax=Lacinutrix sp. TaxID=1937692 RepID=UPI0025BE1DEB|nr:TlpA disulfide reductase family protein [Lacinutrix sp.]
MITKRLFRFIKRYTIGLIIFLLIALIGLYIYFVKLDKLDSELKIPQISLENQFDELKSFGDYKGKVLLVDFWFQGCKPCLKEMKFFPELLKKYDSELAIMSISIDPKETTEYILEQKPAPWNFLLSDNKSWTFYNVNGRKDRLIKDLKIIEYPTYLLFDKNGELISTPRNGIAALENKLGGIFSHNLIFKTDRYIELAEKFPYLIIPYTIVVFLILLIQLLIFGVKKLIRNKNTLQN